MVRSIACALFMLVAATAWAQDNVLRWSWEGAGNFPRTVTLSIRDFNGQEMVQLEEWGELRSVDGWGELQRSHRLALGSIRHLGDRRFIVLSDLQQAAEITLAAGGALQLRWFGLSTSTPTDNDLLVPAAGSTPSDWPDRMSPGGTGAASPLLGL